jgi:hypothetical protein
LLLAALAMTVIGAGAASFIRSAHSQVFLVLMLVELLHKVRISLRAHQLVPEPFPHRLPDRRYPPRARHHCRAGHCRRLAGSLLS